MPRRHFSSLTLVAVAFLLFAGCDDSKHPLSDPQKSKPDTRLTGVWRLRGDGGEVTYYHLGTMGDKVPASLMRVVVVTHLKDGGLQRSGEMLLFPTTLGTNTYLNLAEADSQQFELLEKKGWNSHTLGAFLLPKYRVEENTLLVWPVDWDAKKAAIQAGKVKGVVEKRDSGGEKVMFTDTTANLARFVAGAGDSLFAKEPLRLERVE